MWSLSLAEQEVGPDCEGRGTQGAGSYHEKRARTGRGHRCSSACSRRSATPRRRNLSLDHAVLRYVRRDPWREDLGRRRLRTAWRILRAIRADGIATGVLHAVEGRIYYYGEGSLAGTWCRRRRARVARNLLAQESTAQSADRIHDRVSLFRRLLQGGE